MRLETEGAHTFVCWDESDAELRATFERSVKDGIAARTALETIIDTCVAHLRGEDDAWRAVNKAILSSVGELNAMLTYRYGQGRFAVERKGHER